MLWNCYPPYNYVYNKYRNNRLRLQEHKTFNLLKEKKTVFIILTLYFTHPL